MSELKPCPFCDNHLDDVDGDTFYKSGVVWMDTLRGRSYFRYADRKHFQGFCYNIVCNAIYGGCGASISGDSQDETIAAWNRRNAPNRY